MVSWLGKNNSKINPVYPSILKFVLVNYNPHKMRIRNKIVAMVFLRIFIFFISLSL